MAQFQKNEWVKVIDSPHAGMLCKFRAYGHNGACQVVGFQSNQLYRFKESELEQVNVKSDFKVGDIVTVEFRDNEEWTIQTMTDTHVECVLNSDGQRGVLLASDLNLVTLIRREGECIHEWALYRGLNQDEWYCKKCAKTKPWDIYKDVG